MAARIVQVKTGDVVRLKKPHPCGTNAWEVTRVGMDIGLKCGGCGRRVLLVRSEFDRRFRGYIERAEGAPSPDSGESPSAASPGPAEDAHTESG